MRVVFLSSRVVLGIVAVAGVALSGCGNTSAPDAAVPAEDLQAAGAVDDHSGWWCAAHGVPEEVCAQCNSAIDVEYQQKGDWCEEHNRPESQCFICQPDLKAKFAAQYKAKFGTTPPEPEEHSRLNPDSLTHPGPKIGG
jgi:cobalt-zinc-cadmium efflux system membrane fusion protein